MAAKLNLPPELVAIHFPKFVVRYSGRLIPKRVVLGTVPERLRPVYMPCKTATSVAYKAVKRHWWKILLALGIVLFVVWLIKWQPGAAADRRRMTGGGYQEQVPPVNGQPAFALRV